MLFNSWDFAVFGVVVWLLYVCLPHRAQNRLLLVASYIFYGWWDVRFLALLIFSTVVDYVCARWIHAATQERIRRRFLMISILSNLGILGTFKYWDFFAGSAQSLLARLGIPCEPFLLRVVLPVGISFYTFQALSYTIDVYRRKIAPARSLWDFSLYVVFFPQLVAGPIERSEHLLPQLLRPRRVCLDDLEAGFYLILWGLVEKVYVADTLAGIADAVFNRPAPYHGADVLMALYAFAFQIYCDFDGYSNIARGTARCFGVELMVNFRQPYAATNPVDFWRRWHISLSTWLRDYLYIPLGGNRAGRGRMLCNLLITMGLGGLWHGAAWTFVLWGLYHGVLLVGYRLAEPFLAQRPLKRWRLPEGLRNTLSAVVVFHLVCAGWLLFRAQSLDQAIAMGWSVLRGMTPVELLRAGLARWSMALPIGIILVVQWWQVRRDDVLAVFRGPFVLRWAWCTLLFHLLTMFGAPSGRQFIYFQF